MPRIGTAWLVCAAVVMARSAAAQPPAASQPGPYVVDLRVAMTALPQDPSFFPALPAATATSPWGLGFDVGAHVYLINLGPARVGLGASFFRAGGTRAPPRPSAASSTAPPARQTLPAMDTRVRMLTPQLSFNFGSAAGWSYISAGVGQTSVRTARSEFATATADDAAVVPASTRDSAALQTINVGGGARWFTTDRVAFSFDVRFHKAAARTKNEVSTAAVTLITVAAGISLR